LIETERKTSIQIKADEKVLRAIASLEDNPHFTILKDWISSSFLSMSTSLSLDMILPDKVHFIAQGKAIALYEIREIIKNARTLLRARKDA